MAESAPEPPEPPEELRGASHRKSEGFNPVEMVRELVRSSPWFVIAVAAHVVVLSILAVMTLGHGESKKDDAVVITTTLRKNEAIDDTPEEKKDELIDRSAIPENVEAELVPNEVATLLPTEAAERDLTQDIGDPNSNSDMPNSDPTGGTSVGVGASGHRGTGTPSAFAGRKLGTGARKGVLPGGPTQGTEEAIRIGLIWLVRHQNENGSWSVMTCKDHCPTDKPCQPETGMGNDAYNDKFDVGITGLSLLAFLGAGFGHNAKQYVVDTFKAKKSELGKDVVLKGLKWLVARQNPDGSFTHASQRNLYNEAIATLALCEAYGFTQNRAWKEPSQRAINFLCAAQKDLPNGTGKWGWRYDTPADVQEKRSDYSNEKDFLAQMHDADTSVTGWMVMALKSAHTAGLDVPKDAEDGAINFVKSVSRQDGLVGYLTMEGAGLPISGEHDTQYKYHASSMAAVGMCVRVFLEQNIDDPYLKLSADQIVKALPSIDNDSKDKSKSLVDYYYWYYGSLALNQLDGPDSPKRTNKYWGPWNKAMQDTVLSIQSKEEKQCATGGFLKPDRWSYGNGGPIYTTAINILTLEVYYRYENAFGAAANRRMKKGVSNAKPDKTGESKPDAANGDKSNK